MFQSTYLYKVRHNYLYGITIQAGFNPRTYIRYDKIDIVADRVINVSIHVPI